MLTTPSMPDVLENKSTLTALDLNLEQISPPFTYEQGDDRFPVSYSLDYFILMQINTRSIDTIAKSELFFNNSSCYFYAEFRGVEISTRNKV